MRTYTETNFEDHIEQHLNQSGYRSRQSFQYNKSLCLIPNETLQFIQDTQPEVYQRLERQLGGDTSQKLLDRVSKQIANRGVLDVLRKGVKDRGCDFKLTYFRPSSGMNPDHQRLYAQNRFSLIRQLKYSERNENSLDMTLFLNGLPLVTTELKNSLTGQTAADAEKQYRTDRDPREPLFRFKRCLVHFAIGNEKVSMTTHLQGDKTRFFPFNKDIENPVNPEGHKTAYLWEDILQPDNLIELINNFIHEQETIEKVYDPKSRMVKDEKSRVLIFPRYHQLDVIRKLETAIVAEDVGHNYLIQHTTGSGKSNSIAWLAHLLTHLYSSSDTTNRIFDSIIVVTDRTVLDRQLRNTIRQVAQVEGVVHANELPPSTSIADSFKDPQYRILIVANKFQTGFDEPLLQTMYVDKRLDGLQCVQTLSRLNRVATGKTDTLVLDFVNEPGQIQEAFQQYYQTTMLAEETDPNRLYDLQHQLEGFELYDEATIEEFCGIFYDADQPAELLQGVLDGVVERWSELEMDTREKFRSTLQSYIRLYGYISQLITFTDVELEKLYVFGRSLNKKLPKRDHPDLRDVLASVDLDSFRVQRTHEELQLPLETGDSEVEGIRSEVAPMRHPEQDFLSSIIEHLNSAHQTDFTAEDKVDIKSIHQKVHENEELRQVIEGDNSESNKRYKFDQVFDDILHSFFDSKFDLFKKLSQPEIKADLMHQLYQAYCEQSSSASQLRD